MGKTDGKKRWAGRDEQIVSDLPATQRKAIQESMLRRSEDTYYRGGYRE